MFERSVRRFHDRPAVSDDTTTLTYGELAARAGDLAARLGEHGIGLEDRVGLYMSRGVGMIAAVLGVLQAGAAYLPIDTRYPDARKAHMLSAGGARILVTEPEWGQGLEHASCPVIEWAPEGDAAVSDAADAAVADAGAPVAPAPANAACILFTSGSTGTPRGILLEHRQMVSFALDAFLPEFEPGWRTAQAASVSFDTFTFEVWRTLAGGAEIVVTPDIAQLVSLDMRRALRRYRITAMLAPAIALNHVVRHDRETFATLELLCSGGDVVLPSTCADVLASEFTGELYNLYGPTETTVAATGMRVASVPDGEEAVPIGHAFEGCRLYVLDEDQEGVAAGEPGELYVGGQSVGRGYLDQPRLTAERFLPDPFAADGSRMYRTGDRVRARDDGALLYLGRVDSQVKIDGYRVEPQEVERLLCTFEQVREAAVAAVGENSDRRLVAFLVPAGERLSLSGLRAHMTEHAPSYLMPGQFVVLDAMPTDPHGKRNWAQLTSTLDRRPARREGVVAPRSDTERYLKELWQEMLAVEDLCVTDDFFDLGGHSLLAARTRLAIQRELGVTLGPTVLFEQSVLEDLARLIDESATDDSARTVTTR